MTWLRILLISFFVFPGGIYLSGIYSHSNKQSRGPASEHTRPSAQDNNSTTHKPSGPNLTPVSQQFSTFLEIPEKGVLSKTANIEDERCDIVTGRTEGIGYGSVLNVNLGIANSEVKRLTLEVEHWMVPLQDINPSPLEKSEFDVSYRNGSLSGIVQRQIGDETFDLKITLQIDRSFQRVYSAEIEIKLSNPSIKPFELRALQARFSCKLSWS